MNLLEPFKRCSKCRASKPLKEFNRYRASKDGRQGYCRECNASYHRKYSKRPGEKQRFNKRHKKWRDKNPKKIKANNILAAAVKKGIVTVGPCSVNGCGKTCETHKIEGHHYDYNKPLEVIWFCVKHHKAFHRTMNEFFDDFLKKNGITGVIDGEEVEGQRVSVRSRDSEDLKELRN